MTKRKNWSKEEEQVLLSQIKKHANNLSEAFRCTSKLIDRSFGSCSGHWYTVMLKNPDTAPRFITTGSSSRNVNRKNVAINTSDNTKKVHISLWNRLLSIFKIK